MRLYSISFAGQRRWYGTQADANAGKREFGVGWEEVDVPTDKPSLLAWLNEQQAKPSTPIVQQPAAAVQQPQPDAQRDAYREKIEREISIEEAIGKADFRRAIVLAEHIHSRIMELAGVRS